MNKRAAGVLMPVSALPSGYSSGSFGKDARAFIDFLCEAGFSYWQVLPFTATDEYASPYGSPSAFSINPYFVDVEELYTDGLITEEELNAQREEYAYRCEYEKLATVRLPLLFRAAERYRDTDALLSYLEAHPEMEEYARFMGLKRANGDTPWRAFFTDVPDPVVYRTYAFIIHRFMKQWRELRAYAAHRGVSVIGDIPIYVAYESADVAFHPTQFDLTATGLPRGVAGVPPDYFSEDGQLWGNPLYRWDVMEHDGFSWWRARVRHTLSLFDGVRLDHFRGFDTYYEIPATANTAREGAWHKGPGCPFIDMLKEEAAGALLIAEDLGERMSTVDALLAYSGFPGMRVFSFAFEGAEESRHLPHHYPGNTVAYTGTHDNDTLVGYLLSRTEEQRRAVFSYCHYRGTDLLEGARAVREVMYASHADLVVFPIQDLLLFGSDTRFNTPGTAGENWRFRVTREQMDSLEPMHFRELARRYSRI